jgi:hypothetical protein
VSAFDVVNKELRDVVRQLSSEIIENCRAEGADLNSFEFLSKFPFKFTDPEDNDSKGRILEAALSPAYGTEVKRAIEAAYSDSKGLTPEGYVCEAVEDFLNYVIPRIAGLPDEEAVFDQLYQQFDDGLLGNSCLVTVIAVLSNVWDGEGTVLSPGFRLRYVGNNFKDRAENRWSRDRVVPYIEMSKAAHPIGRGRQIAEHPDYFILEYSAALPKDKDLIANAYNLRDEITSKFILAVRLLKHSDTFSDYRGFRMLGHLSAFRLNLMNFPDEVIGYDKSAKLDQHDEVRLGRLLPKLASEKSSRFFVLDTKVEDAIRRNRGVVGDRDPRAMRIAVDQLLDYCQILEAILPTQGKDKFARYTSVLLKEYGQNQCGNNPCADFDFVTRMYEARNDVMHGRIDTVLANRTINLHDVDLFGRMIHVLAGLYVMNGQLKDIAVKLFQGKPASIESLYPPTPEKRGKLKQQQSNSPAW